MEVLLAYWPIIAGVTTWSVVVTAFIVRLEGLVKMTRNDQDHLAERIDRQDTHLNERLAKIDGRLETIATSLERVIWRIPRIKDDGPDS